MLPNIPLPGVTQTQFKSPWIKMMGNQSCTPISGETLVSRIIYCSIYHVSKAYFHCSISSKGQACHHLSMLWCNNLKLENSHRTKSGTKSRRHIQLEFVEASLRPCQFLLVEMVSKPAWGYLGLLEKLMRKTHRGISGSQWSWSPGKSREVLLGYSGYGEFLIPWIRPILLGIWIIHTQRAIFPSIAASGYLQQPPIPLCLWWGRST